MRVNLGCRQAAAESARGPEDMALGLRNPMLRKAGDLGGRLKIPAGCPFYWKNPSTPGNGEGEEQCLGRLGGVRSSWRRRCFVTPPASAR